MIALFFCLFVASFSQNNYGCHGTLNENPIYTKDPQFIKQVPNGKMYITSASEPNITIVHMWGTPYQMGYAHGQLTKDLAQQFYSEVFAFIEAQVQEAINFLPKFLQDLIAHYGVEAALELTYWMTQSYIPQYFLEEMKGFSDGSGVDYMHVVRIHMFPELIKAHCSMVGAWGPATQASNNGSLVQLRALDWATNGPFQKFPAVLVYHPSDPNSHSFALYSFIGFVGALTGVSEVPLGICEKVWLSYNGSSSRSGIPWHFMLRDMLQFDLTVDDAINRANHAARTCSIHIGVGDTTNNFRVMDYSYESVTVYDDGNYPIYEGHPRRKGLVYVNKHVQPSTNPCLANMLMDNYGNISAEFMIRTVTALHQTGDAHAAVYDYGNDGFFVASASVYVPGKGAIPAYTRPWTRLSLSKLWAEKAPTFN